MTDNARPVRDNRTIAAVFRETADRLERQGESVYRVNAYRRGASVVFELDRPAVDILEEGGEAALVALPGIGKGLAAAIGELATKGRLELLETLRAEQADDDAAGDDEVPF